MTSAFNNHGSMNLDVAAKVNAAGTNAFDAIRPILDDLSVVEARAVIAELANNIVSYGAIYVLTRQHNTMRRETGYNPD